MTFDEARLLRELESEAYPEWREIEAEARQPLPGSLAEHAVYLRKRGEPKKQPRTVRKPSAIERDWRVRRAEYLRRKA